MPVQQREVVSAKLPTINGADMETEVFYYRPWWFIRTMFLIAWCAFRHPFSTSTIDVSTGHISRAGEGD